MDLAKSATIDVVEAAYDLDPGPEEWLPRILEAGRNLFDLGLGANGALSAGASPDGQPLIVQMVPGTASPRVLAGLMQSAQELGSEMVQQTTEALAGGISVFSECRERWPRLYESITRNTGCNDFINLWALDPDCHGSSIVMPSPDRIDLTPRAREQWQMLNVHMTAGHRLRRQLIGPSAVRGIVPTEMPLQAEALLDPKGFSVSDAVGGATTATARATIREAAARLDRARGRLRKRDPEEALEIWHGLVRGRWSLVDWFDTDGRRFVLAKPNAPNLGDPRGLTEREQQVATYAARGESSKLVAYRFGISRARVSTLLRAAMRKLGVKTQAQLVDKMRGFPTEISESR